MMPNMCYFKEILILKDCWYRIMYSNWINIDIICKDLCMVDNLKWSYLHNNHSDIVQMSHMCHYTENSSYNLNNKFNWGNCCINQRN